MIKETIVNKGKNKLLDDIYLDNIPSKKKDSIDINIIINHLFLRQ